MQIGDSAQIYNEFTNVGFRTQIIDELVENESKMYLVNSRIGKIWVLANRVKPL